MPERTKAENSEPERVVVMETVRENPMGRTVCFGGAVMGVAQVRGPAERVPEPAALTGEEPQFQALQQLPNLPVAGGPCRPARSMLSFAAPPAPLDPSIPPSQPANFAELVIDLGQPVQLAKPVADAIHSLRWQPSCEAGPAGLQAVAFLN